MNPESRDPKRTRKSQKENGTRLTMGYSEFLSNSGHQRCENENGLMKVRKKSNVTKIILDNIALNGSGVGQDFSIQFFLFFDGFVKI